MNPDDRSPIMACIQKLYEVATKLSREPGLSDYAAQIEEATLDLSDAAIYELCDKERIITDLREELRRERIRRPVQEPHWRRLDQMES